MSITRLLTGTASLGDALRYGRLAGDMPAHVLHFSADKKPLVVWNLTGHCNLECMHCYFDSHDQAHAGELTTKESPPRRPAQKDCPSGWPFLLP